MDLATFSATSLIAILAAIVVSILIPVDGIADKIGKLHAKEQEPQVQMVMTNERILRDELGEYLILHNELEEAYEPPDDEIMTSKDEEAESAEMAKMAKMYGGG
ncbi:MAG: hypothetical protein LBP58_08580 [Azoarcus sp.]|jgi:hypothetical protein|nr:hypothetical protein [Azoarcus sp.]